MRVRVRARVRVRVRVRVRAGFHPREAKGGMMLFWTEGSEGDEEKIENGQNGEGEGAARGVTWRTSSSGVGSERVTRNAS